MTDFPTKAELIAFLKQNFPHPNKREIARAFGIKNNARIKLKEMLRELQKEGIYHKKARTKLPALLWLEVIAPDADNAPMARPLKERARAQYSEDEIPPIYLDQSKYAPPPGTHILARMRFSGDHYRAIPMRIEQKSPASRDMIGIIEKTNIEKNNLTANDSDKWQFISAERKTPLSFAIQPPDNFTLRAGDIVRMKIKQAAMAKSENHSPEIESITHIAHKTDPHALSYLTLARHHITIPFPSSVHEEAENLIPVNRDAASTYQPTHRDLTNFDFVTIDGADAKDFDDAVYGEISKDGNQNDGKKMAVLYVAIADVSYYVKPGSKLDAEAKNRGNSTYLPDMAVPMLPEKLSNDLCSLRAGEIRPVMVAKMLVDANGMVREYEFFRALIKSAARLTYEQAESLLKIPKNQSDNPNLKANIDRLRIIYDWLRLRRDRRGAIDMERKEYKIHFSDNHIPAAVRPEERLTSHKMIEEMMIAANVAAAQFLQTRNAPCVFRVHPAPSFERAEELRLTAIGLGLAMPKKMGQNPKDYQQMLARAHHKDFYDLLTDAVLRAQAQAHYAIENIGHFGLALTSYCHFTSPIRRYSDLCVHRLLAFWLDDDKVKSQIKDKSYQPDEALCQHLSTTERAAQKCEYEAFDRYGALLLQDKIDSEAIGSIAHISASGIFIRLDEYHIEGFMPVRFLLPARLRYQRLRAQYLLETRYAVQDKITVIIHDVNVIRGDITLMPAYHKLDEASRNHSALPSSQSYRHHTKEAYPKKVKKAKKMINRKTRKNSKSSKSGRK